MICLPAPFPGWPRDRAGWKGAAPRPALTQQSGRRESGPRGGASVLPPGIAAPTWGREGGRHAALPLRPHRVACGLFSQLASVALQTRECLW